MMVRYVATPLPEYKPINYFIQNILSEQQTTYTTKFRQLYISLGHPQRGGGGNGPTKKPHAHMNIYY
jgi:hypothetical protein